MCVALDYFAAAKKELSEVDDDLTTFAIFDELVMNNSIEIFEGLLLQDCNRGGGRTRQVRCAGWRRSLAPISRSSKLIRQPPTLIRQNMTILIRLLTFRARHCQTA